MLIAGSENFLNCADWAGLHDCAFIGFSIMTFTQGLMIPLNLPIKNYGPP